ncbi:FAD-dependent monooxygenase [Streptomyces sp. CA-106131]
MRPIWRAGGALHQVDSTYAAAAYAFTDWTVPVTFRDHGRGRWLTVVDGATGTGGEPESSDSLRTFGAVVQALREHAGLSRDQFGELVRFSKHTVASVELGRRMPIGADGAWSRIRPLLSPAVPAYTGVSFVETDLHEAAVRHPATAELLGGGMMFSLADGRGFLTHLETDGSIHAYVAVKAPEDWLPGIDFTDPAAAKAKLLGYFEGWDDRLRALVADADGTPTPRQIHALPVGHRWNRTPGVTLLGNAARLMSPFAGEGANAAMQDGAELATALAGHPGDPEAALSAYEHALFPRVERAAAESAEGLALLFGPDPVRNLVAMMSGGAS